MLILLVGLPSSGKTTAAQILKEMGFSVISSGDIIREEVKKRGLPYTIENDTKIRKWFHEEGREALLLKRLLERARGENLVWDGPRSTEYLEELKEKMGKPVIIAIKSDFKSRFKRDLEKNRFPDLTKERMEKRDKQQLDTGISELMERADHVIDNTNLTKEELKKKIEKILKKSGFEM